MKKISKVVETQRPFANQMFALVNHVHRFYPSSVATIAERDAIVIPQRYEGAIVYVEADQTTYQLRGGSENTDWISLVSSSGAVSHTTLADIGTNTHTQIDTHIADVSVHFSVASISITESQISNLQAYALAAHNHNATYLGISAAAVSALALKSATTTIDVDSAAAPVTGQVLTATGPTAATWQVPAGGSGSGDIVQTGSPADTFIGYFTADKNLSGDANFTWDDATYIFAIKGTAPKMQIEDTDSISNAMVGHIDFVSTAGIAAQLGFVQAGGIFEIRNPTGDIKLDAGVQITGYLTGYAGTPTDGQHLIWNNANSRAEFTTFPGVSKTGTPVDNQIAVFNSETTVEGMSTFTWNGVLLTVEDFSYNSATDKVVIGDGTLSGAGINIDAAATGNPFVNLQRAGSTVAVWKFNHTEDRTEFSSAVDDITFRPGNVDTLTLTGTALTMSGAVIADTLQLAGGTGTQGTFSWNADEETVDLILDGAVLQLGQEVHIHVRNNSGSDILDGTVCMATGTLGASGRITVAPMDGSSPANAKFLVGIATEDIPNDTDGKMTSFGKIRGIDTTGASVSETWVDGDVLWINPTAAGSLTKVEPASTEIGMPIVIVIKAHATTGTIFVRITPIDEHAAQFADNAFRIQDEGDTTKEIAFQASGIATGTVRTITMPDTDVDLGAFALISALTSHTGDSTIHFTVASLGLNVANWDTAYGWGNHSSAGYLTSETSHADVLVDGDFVSNGIMLRTNAGVYSITANNSANWDTAYGWGNHASAGYADSSHTHTLAAGATDVTATAAEVNLLDLSGRSVGDILSADSATTASWKAPTVYAFGEYVSGWAANAGSFPTATNQGDWFNVTVAGTVDGQAFVVGDTLIALIASPSTSVFAGNWSIVPAVGGISDHTGLTNIGTNTHAQIDTHLSLSTVHFTQAAISITESQISDLQAYLTSETSHADVLVDGDFASNGIMLRTAAGVYSILANASANWNTAYGWGNHASGGYPQSDNSALTGVTAIDKIQFVNNEPSNLTLDGMTGFDASRGLIIYRSQTPGQETGAGVYTILDTANIEGGNHLEITNTAKDISGTESIVFNVTDFADWDTAFSWGNHASAGYTGDQTAAQILTALKTVDGSGSGLDADLLDGKNYSSAAAAAANTVVGRDGSKDIHARLFRSEYDTTNATINFIMTQIDTASNNYIRPSTPAQVRAGLNVENGATADQTQADINALSVEWQGAAKTVSTAAPSGGSDGDIWLQYTA